MPDALARGAAALPRRRLLVRSVHALLPGRVPARSSARAFRPSSLAGAVARRRRSRRAVRGAAPRRRDGTRAAPVDRARDPGARSSCPTPGERCSAWDTGSGTPAGFALAGRRCSLRRRAGRAAGRPSPPASCAGLAGLCRTEWGVVAAAAAALACVVRPRRKRDGLRRCDSRRRRLRRDPRRRARPLRVPRGCGRGPGRRARPADGACLPKRGTSWSRSRGLPDWRNGDPRARLLGGNVDGDLPGRRAAGAAAGWRTAPAVARARHRLRDPGGDDGDRRRRGQRGLLQRGSAAVLRGARRWTAAPQRLCRPRLWPRAAFSASSSATGGCFHIGDSAYVGPPLLFAFVGAAGLLHGRDRAGGAAQRSAAASPGRCGGPSAALVVPRLRGPALAVRRDRSRARGRDRRHAFREPGDRRGSSSSSGAAIRAGTAEGEGPRRVSGGGDHRTSCRRGPNPIRHMLYLPGYLTADNEPAVLAELVRAPPAAVVLWRRPVSETTGRFSARITAARSATGSSATTASRISQRRGLRRASRLGSPTGSERTRSEKAPVGVGVGAPVHRTRHGADRGLGMGVPRRGPDGARRGG